MDRKEIADIIVNQKRTYIPDDDYKRCQRELMDEMLENNSTSDTIVSGMLDMFDCLDDLAYKTITLKDFIDILREIDQYRNEKTIARLSRTNFKSLGGMNE